jgi:tetratricopeptide (TPR) repeat protein
MKIKSVHFFLLSLLFVVWLFTGWTSPVYGQEISATLKEIETLYKKESYSIVLEKALSLLNTRADRLAPSESAFLHYYIGLSYKNNDNNDMAADYFKQIEHKYPVSDYLKLAYLELADIFKEDYFQKESYLEKVFANYPRTPEAVNAGIALSRDYLRLKNYKKSLPVLETIVNLWKKGEEAPELYMLLAVSYSGINDFIEAIIYLRLADKKIKAVIDANPLYLFEAGKISYNNLNFDNAIKYLEKLFNVFPSYKKNSEAANLLAQSYEKVGKLFLSAVFLIKAIERKPSQKQRHTLMLNLGSVLGKLDEKEIAKIKRNYPLHSNSNKLLTLVKNNSKVFEERRTATILLSGELKKGGNMEESIDNFHRFLKKKREPIVEKMFKKDLDTYLDQLDKKEEAEALFKTWIKLKKRKSYLSGDNMLRFGRTLVKLQLYGNADEVYRHLIKYQMFSKYWPESLRQLARIYYQLGDYNRCLEFINRLNLTSEPGKSEFNYYKSIAYHNLKKDEPLKDLLEKVSYNKLFTIFQYRLAGKKAIYLENEERYNEALEFYQKMLQFNDTPKIEKGQLMSSIADLYYKVKDMESSLSYYRLAEQYGANLEWSMYRIVSILWDLDKKPEAKQALEKLKNTSPKSFWVKQLEKHVK